MLQKAAIFFLLKKSMCQRYVKQCKKKKTWYMMFLTTFVFARRIGAFTRIEVVDNIILYEAIINHKLCRLH